jgi:adenylate kinase
LLPCRIGITGTPGTGKRTLATLLSLKLGWKHISIEEWARNASGRRDVGGEIEVEPRRLWPHIRRSLPSRFIISGHLLPSIVPREALDMVIVLRCNPIELERRLMARGYPPDKVKDNVVAEAIDLIFTEAIRRFGPSMLAEFDTTSKPPEALLCEVMEVLENPLKARWGVTDWLSVLHAEGRLDLLL